MGRHQLCKLTLAGSIPAPSTKYAVADAYPGKRTQQATPGTTSEPDGSTFARAEGMQTGASEALSRWFDSTRAHHSLSWPSGPRRRSSKPVDAGSNPADSTNTALSFNRQDTSL